MDKRQKMMQQWYLDEEIKIIQQLHKIYSEALKDINRNIKKQMERFDPETGDLPQSAIYQIKYQQMLRGQVEDVLNNLQTSQYLLMSDYLDDCYEDGFVGSVFDMHGQGVPLMMPIDRNAMVQAVTLDSKISKGLYTRLGEDVTELKKKITSEVSRSILTGTSYAETARQLAGITRIGYNNAIRITRTDGHRIQVTATMDAMEAAKDRGADVVKQWDSTLDGRTRPSHRRVDGEIRELDESFSNGLKFPGDADGRAAEVINCRCALLERARWAVDGGFTKRNNFTGELETFDTPDDYAKFKKDFFSNENVKYMNYVQQMQDKYGTNDFRKVLEQMTDQEYKHYTKLLNDNPIYTIKVDAEPATLETFPEMFYKNAAGKKATRALVDALNEVDGLNPDIRELYTSLGDLPNLPDDCSISYTTKGHALDRWTRYGETIKCKLKIPKMVGDDLAGQNATAFHEIAHFIDMGVGDKKSLLSSISQDLTDVVKSSGRDIPDDIRGLFDDFANQYKQVNDDLNSKYKVMRDALSDDYRSAKITYTDYRKQWKALIREQQAEKDYLCRNLGGGGVPMLSDIYDALSGGSYRDNGTLIYGHGGRYYRDLGNRNCEIFANYMSLSVNRPDLIALLRKDKPELCSALDRLIEEMVGGLG